LRFTLLRETITDLLAMPPSNSPEQTIASAVVGLAGLGVVLALVAGRAQSLILTAAVLLAVPAAWTADRFGHYFFAERQVIFILPFLYLLAAAGITFTAAVVVTFLSRLDPFRTDSTGPRHRTNRGIRLAAGGAVLTMAVLWGFFSWSSIQNVYADRLNSKEDWRGAAAFIASAGCSGAQYYTNVSTDYQYGIGYYQPQLTSRARFIHQVGKYERSLTAALSAYEFDGRDWIVLLSFADGAPAGAPIVHTTLIQKGWSHREFPDQRLRVYYRVTRPECGTGTASGSTPASSRRSDPISAGPQPR
jgi:hypothetical protein